MGNLYSIIRKVHLYTAFIVAAFLFMYFFTGGVLILHEWFPRNMGKENPQTVPINAQYSEDEIVSSLKEQFSINGFLRRDEKKDGTIVNVFTRPGYRAQITFSPGRQTANVNIQHGTFAAVMNSFHRLRGFDGFAHTLWAVFYDLSCIALILFSLSGLYLWWKLIRDKTLGLFFLFTSTGVTLFTIIYLLTVG